MQANPPVHVAVVMDGNGRWATKNKVTRAEGHKKGADVARQLLEWAGEAGIKYLTLFAFSSENWSRPQEEVDAIFHLLVAQIREYRQELKAKGVRVKFVGDLSRLDPEVKESVDSLEAELAHEHKLFLQIALSYGARDEIVAAVKKIVLAVQENKVSLPEINESLVQSHLFTQGIPDPDLLIRTSGERRLSNFLLWQSAYTELYFTESLWPDFSQDELGQALSDFAKRKRRYGGRQAVATEQSEQCEVI